MSVDRTRQALAELEAVGLIRGKGRGLNRTNEYRLFLTPLLSVMETGDEVVPEAVDISEHCMGYFQCQASKERQTERAAVRAKFEESTDVIDGLDQMLELLNVGLSGHPSLKTVRQIKQTRDALVGYCVHFRSRASWLATN
jgi:hypothetical protein